MFNKRFLFIGFNINYINPYRNMVLKTLGSLVELEYYGPGYVSSEELEIGVENWINKRKPYDFLVCDAHVVLKDKLLKMKKLFSMSVVYFNKNLYEEYVNDYFKFYKNSTENKIIIANWDPYTIDLKTINFIKKTNAYVIDFFGKNLSSDYKNLQQKKFKIATNFWYNFLKLNQKKIIVYPHAISNSEFDFKSLQDRKHLFSVLGVGYKERRESKKLLSFELKIKDFKNRIQLFFKEKLSRKMNNRFMLNYKRKYFEIISNSKFSYCSGSELKYPVRKYFEIPSRGSVPIGKKCNGFQHLGFVDKENFIVANNLNEIREVIYNIDHALIQEIANSSRNNIWKNHSEWARKEQISKALNLIFKKEFYGSDWSNGNFLLYKQPK